MLPLSRLPDIVKMLRQYFKLIFIWFIQYKRNFVNNFRLYATFFGNISRFLTIFQDFWQHFKIFDISRFLAIFQDCWKYFKIVAYISRFFCNNWFCFSIFQTRHRPKIQDSTLATMFVRLVSLVGHQRVSKFVVLLQDYCTKDRILSIWYNA